MTMEPIITATLPAWPPDRTATRDLSHDFSRMVFGVDIVDLGVSGGLNVKYLIMSAITPVSLKVFSWEAAERRADWEETRGHFVEFSNVEDLLSDLHS